MFLDGRAPIRADAEFRSAMAVATKNTADPPSSAVPAPLSAESLKRDADLKTYPYRESPFITKISKLHHRVDSASK